ncbi:MAG: hypothetical protein WD552_01815 [Candidatus Paceibacterota bacterium]
MAESYNKNNKLHFASKESQQKFFQSIKDEAETTWKELAGIAEVPQRTFSDWKRGKHAPSLEPVKILSEKFGVGIPEDAQAKDRFWKNKESAKLGGKAKYEKYGSVASDDEHRRKQWKKWWSESGKFDNSLSTAPTPIKKPEMSEGLAEFVGIMLGDGGITDYQVRVTLHSDDDKQYAQFVCELIENLFKTQPRIYEKGDKRAVDITISRKNLVKFCNQIGLKSGSKKKHKADIPNWIKEDKNYLRSCLRGLFDTDGCIYNECHKVNKVQYCYPRLHFVSAIPTLRTSIRNSLKSLYLGAKIRNNRAVTLEKRVDIVQFFASIGTSNPKHQKRFEKFIT